jgi:uncharacterized protein YbjT (DUF2867 family)
MAGDDVILLTGASGYVGGRLLRELQDGPRRLRCLARRPEYLRSRVPPAVEITAGDVMDPESLVKALTGIHTAYYLVHSMGAKRDFVELDRQGAENFGAAAKQCGVRRIVYLGGLGDSRLALSPHLRSRQEVGEILRQSGVQIVEFRASIVLGSGSLSFEMIRALVERLPFMITPRWVAVKAQPIAITDLLAYLVQVLDKDFPGHPIFEIGGTDRVSYGELMQEYARQRGLKRRMLPVPVLTPRLSSLWLGLVTPIYARIGKKLINSLRHETVVHDDSAAAAFPIRPKGVGEAIAEAIRNEEHAIATTRWSDAVSASGWERSWSHVNFGHRRLDVRARTIKAPPEKAFGPIQRIGGQTGWYYADWIWRLRGFLDLLVGGVGVRRGRPHPEEIHVGDTIDWWRVESYEPDRRLRLFAEMKLPGRAWLDFDVEPTGDGSTVRQIAMFDPVGLPGLLYWYLVYPVHVMVFKGMLRGIAERACSESAQTG